MKGLNPKPKATTLHQGYDMQGSVDAQVQSQPRASCRRDLLSICLPNWPRIHTSAARASGSATLLG
jgi:hypothetical protein